MAQQNVIQVKMQRKNQTAPWGFRMNGGTDLGRPLFIQKISRNGLAHKHGLEPGDVVLKICGANALHLTHEQAKMEIIRAGCDLDLMVQKHAIDLSQMPEAVKEAPPAPKEEKIGWEGTGAENKQLQSRSFKMLEMCIAEAEASGEKPPSVIDEKRGTLPAHAIVGPNDDLPISDY